MESGGLCVFFLPFLLLFLPSFLPLLLLFLLPMWDKDSQHLYVAPSVPVSVRVISNGGAAFRVAADDDAAAAAAREFPREGEGAGGGGEGARAEATGAPGGGAEVAAAEAAAEAAARAAAVAAPTTNVLTTGSPIFTIFSECFRMRVRTRLMSSRRKRSMTFRPSRSFGVMLKTLWVSGRSAVLESHPYAAPTRGTDGRVMRDAAESRRSAGTHSRSSVSTVVASRLTTGMSERSPRLRSSVDKHDGPSRKGPLEAEMYTNSPVVGDFWFFRTRFLGGSGMLSGVCPASVGR